MRSALAIASAFVAAGGPSAAREPLAAPPAISGLWAPEPADGCGPQAGRLALGAGAAPVAGLRAVTSTRWYVDLSEEAGLRRLDINLLADGRLLVAERPLGEARFFKRCGEG